jgi:transcriptional regulator with XRE-family HTH domain
VQREKEVGAFLRSRRERADPDEAGVRSLGRRRVPGLRREELAALAGVSVSYYTRIEQGQGGTVSPAVLDALASALRLHPDERAHLHRLGTRPGSSVPPAEHVRAELGAVVAALTTFPAAVLGRSMEILSWNRGAHVLFASHVPFAAPFDPATRPNWAELFFCDPRSGTILVDRARTADALGGRLRASMAAHPHDEELAAFVARLHARSGEFAAVWDSHPVRREVTDPIALRHPDVGAFAVGNEVLRSTADPDQLLLTFPPVPGSDGERALATLLAGCAP